MKSFTTLTEKSKRNNFLKDKNQTIIRVKKTVDGLANILRQTPNCFECNLEDFKGITLEPYPNEALLLVSKTYSDSVLNCSSIQKIESFLVSENPDLKSMVFIYSPLD